MQRAWWHRATASLRGDRTAEQSAGDETGFAAWAARFAALTSPALADTLLGPRACIDPGKVAASRRHNRLVRQAQTETLRALADIEVLILKGLGNAVRLYDDADARGVSDLDLLIAPAKRDTAIAALIDRGYRFAPSGQRRISAPNPNSTAPLISPDRLSNVDIHSAAEFGRAARALPTSRLFARARPLDLGGASARVPAPEDSFLIGLANLSRDKFGAAAPRKLLDLAALVSRYELDWHRIDSAVAAGDLQPVLRTTAHLLVLSGLPKNRLPQRWLRPYFGPAALLWPRLEVRWLDLSLDQQGYTDRLAEELFLAAGLRETVSRSARRLQLLFSPWDGVPARWRDYRI